MSEKINENNDIHLMRFADFMAKMIEKYGAEILRKSELMNEHKNTKDKIIMYRTD